jgi:hypothetical protein
MFFYRNKHMQVDFGTGNNKNNKINFDINNKQDKQELIDIIEVVYSAARKGHGLAAYAVDETAPSDDQGLEGREIHRSGPHTCVR